MNTSFPASYRITLMLLILYALALVPFSAALPGWVSYENNLLENAQVIVLLGGALLCVHFAHYSQGSPTHGMWLPSAGIFLILLSASSHGGASSWSEGTLTSASRSSSLLPPCHTARRSMPQWVFSLFSVCIFSYDTHRGSASSGAFLCRGSTSRSSSSASPFPPGATITRSTTPSEIRSSKRWRSFSCTSHCVI